MTRLDAAADALGAQPLHQEFRDLGRHPLLELKALGVHLHDARNLREADDRPARKIADMRATEEGQQVVLTQRIELDVPHDDHLVVIDLVASAVDQRVGIGPIAGGELVVHPRDACRCPSEPGTLRILADLRQKRPDRSLDLVAGSHVVHRLRMLAAVPFPTPSVHGPRTNEPLKGPII